MIPEAKYVEPSPEWCVRDALGSYERHRAPLGIEALALLIIGNGDGGSTFSRPAFGQTPAGWDGCSFWREARVTPTTIEIEFNENWRERFTNPEWKWYTLSRETFVNA